jgi:acyl dehydratase
MEPEVFGTGQALALRCLSLIQVREIFMPAFVVDDASTLHNFTGKELGVSEWHLITQEQLRQFADATGDRQWIHLDSERAKRESPYGAPIAHGFLTLSMISFLMKEAVEIRGARMAVNYGLNRVRFPAPVRVNAKVRGRFGLVAVKKLPDAVEAIFSVTVECDDAQKPCCAAEWIVRYYF